VKAAGVVVVATAALGLAAGCGGAGHPLGSRPAPAAASGSAHATTTPAAAAPAAAAPAGAAAPAAAVTVTDAAGSRFTVTATAVHELPVVTVHGALWSAAPGQGFLEAQLQVANPTSAPESLGAFDDPSSGLAPAVDFVTDASDATQAGDGGDCGADPAYPSTLCPVSFPQRLTVDADSADTGGPSVVLAPGATAQLTYSYGPVPTAVGAAPFTVWFAGSPRPADLAP
jgi:hypothetical protein